MARHLQTITCPKCGRDVPAFSQYCNWCGFYLPPKPKKQLKVPEPVQLPSGRWRIQLRRENINIVEDTPEKCKETALRLRRQWQADDASGLHDVKFKTTLASLLDDYISAKETTLSASTIRGYRIIRNHRFPAYMRRPVNLIDWQEAINDEVDRGLSAKSIYNAWGLVHDALNYSGIEHTIPTLPRRIFKEQEYLTYSQINTFLEAIRGKDCELGALLALHSLRRSEVFGLRPSDYDKANQCIHVRGAMLYTTGGWEYTPINKTPLSRRDVPIVIPRLTELLDSIDQSSQFIVQADGNLYRGINAVCRSAGLPEVGVHGLRHSFASLAYHLGWKKMSTQRAGGWKNSRVLDAVYTHNADYEADIETMREHFRE